MRKIKVTYERNIEFIHHGVKHQHWGVKNGPPYPLSGENKAEAKKSYKKPPKSDHSHSNSKDSHRKDHEKEENKKLSEKETAQKEYKDLFNEWADIEDQLDSLYNKMSKDLSIRKKAEDRAIKLGISTRDKDFNKIVYGGGPSESILEDMIYNSPQWTSLIKKQKEIDKKMQHLESQYGFGN